MKTKMTKKTKETILIISSFFIGCIVGAILLLVTIPKNNNTNELTKTIKKVEGGVVSIEGYNGSVLDATGSGFIYKVKGRKAYILTNAHVVEDTNILIINSKGEEVDGKVLGKDDKLDIAVVEIDKKYAPKVLKLGDSSKLEAGEEIFTVTSPMGKRYAKTVTKGIVSGLDRNVPTNLEDSSEWLMSAIQFDANINPGSSGGALFNLKGEVVGICSMKLIKEEIEGMSFAIPIEQAINHIKELENNENIELPELGIAMVETSEKAVLETYNVKLEDTIKGVVVVGIKEGSNAEGKLKEKDVIIEIDGEPVTENLHVKYALSNHKIGDTLKVKVLRNNKEKTIDIKLK